MLYVACAIAGEAFEAVFPDVFDRCAVHDDDARDVGAVASAAQQRAHACYARAAKRFLKNHQISSRERA